MVEVCGTAKQEEIPVDAVITWVDGNDPVHKAKLEAYLASIGGGRPRAASPARFHNSNEIEYCVISLLRYAPWIRNIFIVTDEQQPELINKLEHSVYASRVKVVDHKTIFAGHEGCLPTFNIRSIMSVLWRIPGLAENFIFFNDDFALLRPVEKADFFREGKVVVRGRWRQLSEKRLSQRLKNWIRKYFFKKIPTEDQRVRHLAAQEYSAKLAGFDSRYYELEHNPHPWRRSTTEAFFNQHPDLFQKNIQYKFRSSEQFITECLAAHLEIKQQEAIFDNRLSTLQLKPAEQTVARTKNKLQRADVDEHIAFVCVQNLEQAPEQARQMIVDWLNQKIGSVEQFIVQSNARGE